MLGATMDRYCTICHEKKLITDFNKRWNTYDGISVVCRECQEKRKKQRRKPFWYVFYPKQLREQIKYQNRSARKRNAGGKIKKEEWQELKSRYGFKCLCCGRQEPEIKLTLDHIIPISKGGTNTIDNAQPLCVSCNSRKYVQTIDYR